MENKCPICNAKITKKNPIVRYHIRYHPPLVILACKFCNYTEYNLRNNLPLSRCSLNNNIHRYSINRAKKVLLFHNKLGLKI